MMKFAVLNIGTTKKQNMNVVINILVYVSNRGVNSLLYFVIVKDNVMKIFIFNLQK